MSAVLALYGISNGDLQKAKKLIKDAQYEEAKNLLEMIIDKDDQNDSAYYLLGRTWMMLKDFDEAEEMFEEAIELNDRDADYQFWLGQAYANDAMQSNIISQAFLAPKILTQYERTVELDSNHIGGRTGLTNFYLQAPGIMGGDVDKAMEQGKALVKLDEERGRLALANIWINKEMPDSADVQMKILEEKFGPKPQFANFYNVYGYSLLKQNKINEAIVKFEKQIELRPDHPNSYDSLGDAYKAAGRLDEAKAQYEKALKIDPEFSASKKNLEEINDQLRK
jgi:tetratricopeptide (TPR) repeat protein